MRRADTSQQSSPVGHQTTSGCPLFLIKHARQSVLYREIDDLLSLLDCYRILKDEERVGSLLYNRSKSTRKVFRSVHLVGLKRYSHRVRRTLRLFPGKHQCRIGRIPKHGRARQFRHDFL
jgi:hypothetical protein